MDLLDLFSHGDYISIEVRVGITSHRDVNPLDKLLILEEMESLVRDISVKEIVFGGARGGDTIALRAAYSARNLRKQSNPRLIVIVPDVIDSQPQDARPWIRVCADEVIQMAQGLPLTGRKYRVRNEAIVKRSDRLVAFWSGQFRSGVGMTVRIALSTGVPVKVVMIRTV